MNNKNFFLILVLSATFVFFSCNSKKTAVQKDINTLSESTMKANLIDGNWELNYILNNPKNIEELYSKVKPMIQIDSGKNTISGSSGCNNFNGKCTISTNSIKVDEAMALTRKMCPDMTGENLFLETLKKVNSYSVTNQGKTLNLIMGDIAVMRFDRK